MHLAQFGMFGETGVNRPAFSAEDMLAKRTILDWASSMDLEPFQDKIGNLFLRYAPSGTQGAPVMAGSHLDSQPSGGRFDGAYGVVAALEVIEALNRSRAPLSRPVEVVAWSNEEGSRFAPGAMGSQYFAGLKTLEDLLDAEDAARNRPQDALEESLRAVSCARRERPAAVPLASVEAHIEQGPVLEECGSLIGIVEGIQGWAWLNFEIIGAASHAGTTPFHRRKYALRLQCASSRGLKPNADRYRWTAALPSVV